MALKYLPEGQVLYPNEQMKAIQQSSSWENVNADVIVVKLGFAACGLFSYIIRAMHSMYYFYPRKIYIDWTEKFAYANYDGQNVWNELFYQPDMDILDTNLNSLITYGNVDKNGHGLFRDDFLTFKNGESHFYPTDLDRIRAKKLIDEKIRLKEHIKNKIENFYYLNIKNKKCLAVHRRNCIYQHSEKITDEKFNTGLFSAIDEGQYKSVFLCSDNIESKENLKSVLAEKGIETVFYDSHLSKNSKGYGHCSIYTEHANEYDVYDVPGNVLAEEAIIESYLMSMCDAIYKSCSGMSNYSLFLNPELKVYDVDKNIKYNNR